MPVHYLRRTTIAQQYRYELAQKLLTVKQYCAGSENVDEAWQNVKGAIPLQRRRRIPGDPSDEAYWCYMERRCLRNGACRQVSLPSKRVRGRCVKTTLASKIQPLYDKFAVLTADNDDDDFPDHCAISPLSITSVHNLIFSAQRIMSTFMDDRKSWSSNTSADVAKQWSLDWNLLLNTEVCPYVVPGRLSDSIQFSLSAISHVPSIIEHANQVVYSERRKDDKIIEHFRRSATKMVADLKSVDHGTHLKILEPPLLLHLRENLIPRRTDQLPSDQPPPDTLSNFCQGCMAHDTGGSRVIKLGQMVKTLIKRSWLEEQRNDHYKYSNPSEEEKRKEAAEWQVADPGVPHRLRQLLPRKLISSMWYSRDVELTGSTSQQSLYPGAPIACILRLGRLGAATANNLTSKRLVRGSANLLVQRQLELRLAESAGPVANRVPVHAGCRLTVASRCPDLCNIIFAYTVDAEHRLCSYEASSALDGIRIRRGRGQLSYVFILARKSPRRRGGSGLKIHVDVKRRRIGVDDDYKGDVEQLLSKIQAGKREEREMNAFELREDNNPVRVSNPKCCPDNFREQKPTALLP
ncbi:hypothetical protein CLF_104744 [Clonorchis sinensis]|uniref:Uncharacterized protein n=1 Tax=Clonorchis sinensis TaxID=79923 RepID=G7YNY8_CLOSI|nr:hypothetical protein CLF_104744 [Clonorchis sinensis]